MTLRWKAAIAGGTIAGVGFGGFVAADEVDRHGDQFQQVSASAGSGLSAPVRYKAKGPSWLVQDAVAGLNGATSVDSPASGDSPAGWDSPASPASASSPGVSIDSPASPSGAGGGGSPSGGNWSANSPASPPSGGGGGGSFSGGSGGGSGS